MNIEPRTLNAQEAAVYLGFNGKNNWRFIKKVNSGEIPGAKPGRDWVFFLPDLVEYLRGKYPAADRTPQADINRGIEKCQSAKRKVVHTTIQDSRSAESEYKSLRAQIRAARRKGMKKNAGEK